MENRDKAVDTEGDSRRRGSYQAETDAGLVEACLRGEESAWTELVTRFSALVYGIALKRAGLTREQAEDVYQESWRTIFEKLSTLQDHERLRGWAVSIVWRKCLDLVKEQDRLPGAEEALPDQLPDHRPGPDEMVLRREMDEILDRAIRSIPDPVGRAIVECRFYEGMSYREIHGYLGIPMGSIGPMLGRSLSYLKRYLERFGFSDGRFPCLLK